MQVLLESRIDFGALAGDASRALSGLDAFVARSGLETTLLHLIWLRASQLNGCAYCLDMHTKDARALGEREQRLYTLSAWRETPFFTDRERAALAWTEAVTQVADGHVPDGVYEHVREEFDEAEVAALTAAVVAINAWNRVAISTRMVPGRYEPAR